MTFLPGLDVLLAYSAACVLLVFTPGPDMTLYLGQTLAAGRARGFAALFGALTGLVGHSLLAAFGLSALLLTSVTAFTFVKFAGAAYLLYLAVHTLRHGSALTLQAGAGARRPLHQVYLLGVGINLLNPKALMFFLTFLPQFVSPADPHALGKLFFLGLYFIVLALPFSAVLILIADRFTALVRRSPRIMRAIDWLFAGLMGVFAARLVAARNGP